MVNIQVALMMKVIHRIDAFDFYILMIVTPSQFWIIFKKYIIYYSYKWFIL